MNNGNTQDYYQLYFENWKIAEQNGKIDRIKVGTETFVTGTDLYGIEGILMPDGKTATFSEFVACKSGNIIWEGGHYMRKYAYKAQNPETRKPIKKHVLCDDIGTNSKKNNMTIKNKRPSLKHFNLGKRSNEIEIKKENLDEKRQYAVNPLNEIPVQLSYNNGPYFPVNNIQQVQMPVQRPIQGSMFPPGQFQQGQFPPGMFIYQPMMIPQNGQFPMMHQNIPAVQFNQFPLNMIPLNVIPNKDAQPGRSNLNQNQFKPSNNANLFKSSPSNCVDAIPPPKTAHTNSIPIQMNESNNDINEYGPPIPLVLNGFDASFQEEVRRLQSEERAIKRHNNIMASNPGQNRVQEFEPRKSKSDIKKDKEESITETEDSITEIEDNNVNKGNKPNTK